jgi:Ca2+-binding RTX toxin-like protein
VLSTVSRGLGNYLEKLVLSGTAWINGYGNALDNFITGNIVNNSLYGYAGNDFLTGGAGDDTISSGFGNDTIIGGGGMDTFAFDSILNASANMDTIADFSVVDDTISLDRTIFAKLTTLGTLNTAFFKFSATGNALDSNDYILYNTTTGALLYDADANGMGLATQFATLTTKPTITAADFMVVA